MTVQNANIYNNTSLTKYTEEQKCSDMFSKSFFLLLFWAFNLIWAFFIYLNQMYV